MTNNRGQYRSVLFFFVLSFAQWQTAIEDRLIVSPNDEWPSVKDRYYCFQNKVDTGHSGDLP